MKPSGTLATTPLPLGLGLERKKEFKKHDLGPGKGTVKRMEQTHGLRKAKREEAISAKRLKHHPAEQAQESGPLASPEQVEAMLRVLFSPTAHKSERSGALAQLRLLLSSSAPPLDLVFASPDALPSIVHFLQEPNEEDQLNAAWCLTNLASGSHEQTLQTLSAAPYLIAFLSGSNVALQEQAAWALANMAGDSVQCRDLLRANGVLRPMVQLLASPVGAVAHTAAFGLCNLARGQNPKLMEFYNAGVIEPLVHQLTSCTEAPVLVEVVWLLTYLTTGGTSCIAPLMQAGLATHLQRIIELCATEIQDLVLPTLRVLGNIICSSNALTDAVLEIPQVLPLLRAALDSSSRVHKKEAAWVVSNLTGGKLAHIDAVVEGQFIPILVNMLRTSTFDIKKEAAYALSNIMSEKKYFEPLIEEVLPTFLGMLKAPDLDAVSLTLSLLERMLDYYPEGATLVEEEDAVETIENLQYQTDEGLAAQARHVVDKYYEIIEDAENEEALASLNDTTAPTQEEYPPWRTGQPFSFSASSSSSSSSTSFS
ncbi:Importin subunit alpha [Balamuthia mandrillaris]